MNSKPLSDHIAATYQAIRIGLAIIAFLFPLWLVLGGKIFGHNLEWQDSMSAYYHANASFPTDTHPSEGTMRNWFVGLLFGIGIILYLYKGYTWLENWALNIAGVMALGVALFPMPWGAEFPGVHLFGPKSTLHGACAISLFICIAYVCIYRASDTLTLMTNDEDKVRRERYRKCYRVFGHLMWFFPVIAWVLSSTTGFRKFTFWAELAGIWIFAAYWWVKSLEIAKTKADKKAICGQLKVPGHGASDFNKVIPITE